MLFTYQAVCIIVLSEEIQENKSGKTESNLHLHSLRVTELGIVMDVHLLIPSSGKIILTHVIRTTGRENIRSCKQHSDLESIFILVPSLYRFCLRILNGEEIRNDH